MPPVRTTATTMRSCAPSAAASSAAFSISCLVMVVAGALTAMKLATSLPLTVYLWSFFPALLAVITISAGQQTTHQAGAGGLVILWGGVALLVAYVVRAFLAVRQH